MTKFPRNLFKPKDMNLLQQVAQQNADAAKSDSEYEPGFWQRHLFDSNNNLIN